MGIDVIAVNFDINVVIFSHLNFLKLNITSLQLLNHSTGQ